MTEQSFTTELLKWAKTYGWRCFHVRNSGHAGMTAVQGDKGFPDLVLVKGQRLIFAELKLAKKKPTPSQEEWLQALAGIGPMNGHPETYTWWPEDWSGILAVLSGR